MNFLTFIVDNTGWNFTLDNFGPVWNFMCQLGLIFIFLLIGNLICKSIPFMRKAFIPSAIMGGALLLGVGYLVDFIVSKCGVENFNLIDKNIMQVITYHGLGIGFVAMTLKVNKTKIKAQGMKVLENGAMTGATYMLQAALGIIVTLIIFAFGGKIWKGSGIILPLGFGQGPGNALTWDVTYSDMGLMNTTGSFGLTIASIGFIVASIFGVIYINIFKRKHEIKQRSIGEITPKAEDYVDHNEIGDSESVDKFSIQIGLVLLGYAGSFGIMCLFALISKLTGVALFNSVAWGFNFIWGVITATLIKTIVVKLKEKKVLKRKVINNYQMDRISGFAFDMMIVAGVAAIDIQSLREYIVPIIVLSIVGTIASIVYVRLVCKFRFKGYEHEMFLANFGTLTGTASNGMILLREIDPLYETPTSNLFVKSQFPAMVFVAPLLLLLNFASESDTKLYITLAIFAALFIIYTVFIFLPKKSRKEKANQTQEGAQ